MPRNKKERFVETEQKRERKKSVGFSGNSVTYSSLSTLTPAQIRDLIITNGWIETCIQTIVDEVVKYPLLTKPTYKKLDTFLKYPSEREPLTMIRKKYLKDALRYGNGACLITYKNDSPYSLVAVPGYTLRVVTEEGKDTIAYGFTGINNDTIKQDRNGNPILFSSKEVLHFAPDQDSDSTLGISNITRIYNDVMADNQLAKNLVNMTKSDLLKPFFVNIAGMSKKDCEEFVEYLNAAIVEGAKAFGVNKEATLSEIKQWEPKEIIEESRWLATKIAASYKVPPFMINLVADVGSLNAREQKYRFLESVVEPLLEYEAYLYTTILCRQGFKKSNTEVVTPILPTKMSLDTVKIINQLVGDDNIVLSADEAREIFFGLPPLDRAALAKQE